MGSSYCRYFLFSFSHKQASQARDVIFNIEQKRLIFIAKVCSEAEAGGWWGIDLFWRTGGMLY